MSYTTFFLSLVFILIFIIIIQVIRLYSFLLLYKKDEKLLKKITREERQYQFIKNLY